MIEMVDNACMEEKPATAQEVLEDLAACIAALERILPKDLSLLEVDESWSNIPHLGDHVQFLRDQAAGLVAAVRIVSRPSTANVE